MATPVQIVFDCADPDRLAKFWAAALHYRVQDPPEGYASWEAFLKTAGVPEEEWNSAGAIVDPAKVGPRIYFQKMDTPKPGKNRVHTRDPLLVRQLGPAGAVDVEVDAEVERILGLGATKQRAWD